MFKFLFDPPIELSISAAIRYKKTEKDLNAKHKSEEREENFTRKKFPINKQPDEVTRYNMIDGKEDVVRILWGHSMIGKEYLK